MKLWIVLAAATTALAKSAWCWKIWCVLPAAAAARPSHPTAK
jgi:hypothetical protein